MSRLTALITGASRGIGKAVAMELASNGYNLLLNYNKSKEKAENLVEVIKQKYNVEVFSFKADISKQEEIDQLVKFTFSKFDTIDILVNNAAICIDKEFNDRSVEDFKMTFNLNLFGVFYLSKIIGNKMVSNKFGKIVNISSNNSINGFFPTTIDYDASKSALNILTKNLAIQFAPYVNVNAIAPGWIDTDMNKDLLTNDIKELESQRILKHRIGEPCDVANLVSFLVSERSSYINGQIIVIDGGMF